MKEKEIIDKLIAERRLEDAALFPKVILLDTVSFCNYRCSMCYHPHMTRKQGVMSWGLLKKIIDEIALNNKDTRIWMVFFGEALILKKSKPSIFDYIKYAKLQGLTDIVINTNGCLLDDCAIHGLIDSGLDGIYIGIDAFNADVYSKIRIGGDYNKVVNNVLNLLKIKDRLNIKKPAVYVQFVEMDINKHHVNDFIKFWKEKSVTVKIRPMVSWGGLVHASTQKLDNTKRWPCYWAMQTMAITDSGKVVTCAVDIDSRFIAGDITKQTICDVWNNTLKNMREYHINKQWNKLPQYCRACTDWQHTWADFYHESK